MGSAPAWSRLAGRAFLLVIVLVTAVACSLGGSPPPKDDRVDANRADLVGTWRNSERDGQLVLAQDGTFQADNVPHQMFDPFPNQFPGVDLAKERISGSGTWTLETSREDPTGPHNALWLHFTVVLGAEHRGSFRLIVEKEADSVVVTYYIGDPDVKNRYVYKKS